MKTWEVSVQSVEVEGSPQNGSFECNGTGLPSFRFVEADKKSIPLGDYKYLMIDTASWDAYWVSDDAYIPRDLISFPSYRQDEVINSAKRVGALHKCIGASKELYSPSFAETPKGARLAIEDGRHRIHLIRSLGIPAFPAAVPVSIVEELEQLGILSNA